MNLSKIFYSIFTGLTLFTLLLYYRGDTGLRAMEKVNAYKSRLESNITELEEINRKLNVEFEALSEDEELIKLKARSLGYFDPADRIIHVKGWNPDTNEYNPGKVIKEEYNILSEEAKFPYGAMTLSFLTLFFLTLLTRIRKKRKITRKPLR